MDFGQDQLGDWDASLNQFANGFPLGHWSICSVCNFPWTGFWALYLIERCSSQKSKAVA